MAYTVLELVQTNGTWLIIYHEKCACSCIDARLISAYHRLPPGHAGLFRYPSSIPQPVPVQLMYGISPSPTELRMSGPPTRDSPEPRMTPEFKYENGPSNPHARFLPDSSRSSITPPRSGRGRPPTGMSLTYCSS